MVTFECKFIDLLKNALLLALGKAPLNLVLCLISAAIVVVMYFYIRPGFVLFLSFFKQKQRSLQAINEPRLSWVLYLKPHVS